MCDAANEIDRLSPPDLEGQQRRDVRPEDHPKRPYPADGKRERHAPGHDLSQKQKAEACRHDWRKCKHSRSGHGRRGLEPFEHQHEISTEQAPEHQISPGRLKVLSLKPATRLHDQRHNNRAAQKSDSVERRRVDVIGRHRAERERPRNQRREGQHRKMAAISAGHVRPDPPAIR